MAINKQLRPVERDDLDGYCSRCTTCCNFFPYICDEVCWYEPLPNGESREIID